VPQVTAIKTQKKDPSRVSLYLDGKFAFGLGRDLSTKAGLVVGKKLSEETIENLKGQSEEEKFLNLTYRYLSYRPRSEKEVVNHLTKKKVNKKTIAKIISRLKKQDYLDDEEFALWWIDQRQRFRPRSRYFLKSELIKKGVERKIIDQALTKVDEEALVDKIILKRKSRLKNLEPFQARKKLIGYLQRRGFSWEIIKKGLGKAKIFD
jgi:regulatory protein